MSTMSDALKNIGFNINESEVEDLDISSKIPFPFITSDLHPTIKIKELEDINFIRHNWRDISKEELESSFECNIGKDIYELLKKNFNKIQVIEEATPNYGMECLCFWCEYRPYTKRFKFRMHHSFTSEEVCKEHGIDYWKYLKSFGALTEDVLNDLFEKLDIIVLYVNKNDGFINDDFDIPYTFEEIQKDEVLMEQLSHYLKKLEHQPNPKAKYYVEWNRFFIPYLIRADKR